MLFYAHEQYSLYLQTNHTSHYLLILSYWLNSIFIDFHPFYRIFTIYITYSLTIIVWYKFIHSNSKDNEIIINFALQLFIQQVMIKIILRIVGTISLILGIIGIALPILPTTPFLLLTAFCYLKSAPAWHKRLLESKHLGPYIKNFQENKCIPLRIKVYSISMLWLTISISAIFFVSLWWVRSLLFAIAVGVTIHILSYPSQPKR